jgi:hypothetical protein
MAVGSDAAGQAVAAKNPMDAVTMAVVVVAAVAAARGADGARGGGVDAGTNVVSTSTR